MRKLDWPDRTRVAQVTFTYAESLLTLGHEVVGWLSKPMTQQSAAQADRVACVNGGHRSLRWTDRDASHTLSAGDQIDYTLENCFLPSPAVAFTGTLRVTLQAYASPTALQARVDLPDGGLVFQSGSVSLRWAGGFLVQAWADELHTGLALHSAPDATINLSLTTAQRSVLEQMQDVNLRREVQVGRTGTESSLAMNLSSGLMGGVVRLRTPTPLFAYYDSFPVAGMLQIEGAWQDRMSFVPEALSRGGTSPGRSTIMTVSWETGGMPAAWRELMMGFLWWHDGDLPAAYGDIKAPSARPFSVVGGPVISHHPARREMLLQFTRELQVPPGGLAAQLVRRPSETSDYDWGDARITASVEVAGARVTVRWQQQLQPGREYDLDWVDPTTQQLVGLVTPYGQYYDFFEGRMRVQVAPSTVAALTIPLGPAVVAGTPMMLDASASRSEQGGLLYRWQQVAGPALIVFDTNGATPSLEVPAEIDADPFGHHLAAYRHVA